MPKTSVKAAARQAVQAEKQTAGAIRRDSKAWAQANDSFVNFAAKLGVGADNVTSAARYGFNPITRQRTQLEWMHRGNWVCRLAIDIPADDMTRAGIEYETELEPDDAALLDASIKGMRVWQQINEVVKWSRLYGGCIGVALIDGQDNKTPLRLDTVGIGQFKGLCVLDRWMLEPTLEDIVTEYGPHMGMPRYYRVSSNAPALRGQIIHYSRVAFRMDGGELPYNQRLTENLWGVSVLEPIYDRLVGFDSATAGATQLVYKCYLRTMKIAGLRTIIAAGNKPLEALMQQIELTRRYQGIEGMSILDAEDEMQMETHSAFSGLSDVLLQLGQQLSGALQIPLVRLFGQSPAGLNSTGESDVRTYYDHIAQMQEQHLAHGVLLCYWLAGKSLGLNLPSDFNLKFRSLWELDDTEKAGIAKTVVEAIVTAYEAGLVTEKAAMQELRQSSRVTNVFSNISREQLEQASDVLEKPPSPEELMLAAAGGGLPGGDPNNPNPLATDPANPLAKLNGEQDEDDEGSEAAAGTVPRRPRVRVKVHPSVAAGG